MNDGSTIALCSDALKVLLKSCLNYLEDKQHKTSTDKKSKTKHVKNSLAVSFDVTSGSGQYFLFLYMFSIFTAT